MTKGVGGGDEGRMTRGVGGWTTCVILDTFLLLLFLRY